MERRHPVDADVRLRDVTLDDLELYERLRCDPAMMAELGGPLPKETIPDKLRSDVAAVQRDESWITVVTDGGGVPKGSVVLWSHDEHGERLSEIGWMVLPEFQGRGVAKSATAQLLDRARDDGRWGAIHAFPGVTNAPSNGICRSLGFTLVEAADIEFQGRTLRANHWRFDPTDGQIRWTSD
jgi:RimJ/RimL family protein N-acetyltransferase